MSSLPGAEVSHQRGRTHTRTRENLLVSVVAVVSDRVVGVADSHVELGEVGLLPVCRQIESRLLIGADPTEEQRSVQFAGARPTERTHQEKSVAI